MTTTLAEERAAIRDAVRALMSDHSSEAAVRATMETEQGYDAQLWQRLVELGIVGLLIDPEHGGTGLGPVELELVMEETGAALLCSPLLSSGVLAAGLLRSGGFYPASRPARRSRPLPSPARPGHGRPKASASTRALGARVRFSMASRPM